MFTSSANVCQIHVSATTYWHHSFGNPTIEKELQISHPLMSDSYNGVAIPLRGPQRRAKRPSAPAARSLCSNCPVVNVNIPSNDSNLVLLTKLWAPGIGRVKKEQGSPLPAKSPIEKKSLLVGDLKDIGMVVDGPIRRRWGTRRECIIAGV